jgi:hypothetical protein
MDCRTCSTLKTVACTNDRVLHRLTLPPSSITALQSRVVVLTGGVVCFWSHSTATDGAGAHSLLTSPMTVPTFAL